MLIDLHSDIKDTLTFDKVMQLEGDIYRQLEGRCTLRVCINQKYYFIKRHQGVGWKEIFKNILQLRWPILSAKNEKLAIERLEQLSISVPKIVGYGWRGWNPANKQSFLITRELPHFITLEDLAKQWIHNPPSFQVKKGIIQSVAHIARTLHENGLNHRDFYLCHFLLDLIEYPRSIKIYLIDLHRAHIREYTPMRWKIKDIAGLYFSSKEMKLTQQDRLRFMKAYHGNSLRDLFNKEKAFWLKVEKRGDKLYRKHQSYS